MPSTPAVKVSIHGYTEIKLQYLVQYWASLLNHGETVPAPDVEIERWQEIQQVLSTNADSENAIQIVTQLDIPTSVYSEAIQGIRKIRYLIESVKINLDARCEITAYTSLYNASFIACLTIQLISGLIPIQAKEIGKKYKAKSHFIINFQDFIIKEECNLIITPHSTFNHQDHWELLRYAVVNMKNVSGDIRNSYDTVRNLNHLQIGVSRNMVLYRLPVDLVQGKTMIPISSLSRDCSYLFTGGKFARSCHANRMTATILLLCSIFEDILSAAKHEKDQILGDLNKISGIIRDYA